MVNRLGRINSAISFVRSCFLVIIVFLRLTYEVSGQSKPIDTSCFRSWPVIECPKISDDGRFVIYSIHGSENDVMLYIYDSVYGNTRHLPEISSCDAKFADNSRKLIYNNQANNSIVIISLPDMSIESIAGVEQYSVTEGSAEWVAYQMKEDRRLFLRHLSNRDSIRIPGVEQFSFSHDGEGLIYLQQTQNSLQPQSLKWRYLLKDSTLTLWSGIQLNNYVLDRNDNLISFTALNSHRESALSVWLCKRGQMGAIRLVDGATVSLSGIKVGGVTRFSNDGDKVFFSWENVYGQSVGSSAAKGKVDIWSYTDRKLQSQQMDELLNKGSKSIGIAACDLNSQKVVRLQEENEEIRSVMHPPYDDRHFILHTRDGDAANEWSWNSSAGISVYLVSTHDGKRKLIDSHVSESVSFFYRLSPSGSYLVYYDPITSGYLSYDVNTGTRRNMTNGLRAVWTTSDQDDIPAHTFMPIGIAGWMDNSGDVLIYDQTDIWRLDPSGRRKAENITKQIGLRDSMIFRFAFDYYDKVIDIKDKLILNVFDRRNKNNGFYSIDLNKDAPPQKLIMDACIFKGPVSPEIVSFVPLKARDADVYLVRRMTARESPNYFITRDFLSYKKVTDNYPENNYTWLTSEIVQWQSPDKVSFHGILYRPSNFDPQKKYPVIFYFYERLSETLNAYIEPRFSNGPLNIPYYVSNGYVIFVPDILYKKGSPGKSALRSIVSAANYFSDRSWVNKRSLGMQGHSFGGYEVNYVITHSNLFSAAVSSAGVSNFVSGYGGLRSGGSSRQAIYEWTQSRIGSTLWNSPGLFIKNSPVLYAHKVTTPLLLINNKNDQQVPFGQGIEFFTALRRLGKKAWMLQYDDSGHLISDESAEDFTIRMKQFFDHYLKDSLPPKWMTRGIPAKMKGIDDGLELDNNIKTPSESGLLTEDEKKKVDALKNRNLSR